MYIKKNALSRNDEEKTGCLAEPTRAEAQSHENEADGYKLSCHPCNNLTAFKTHSSTEFATLTFRKRRNRFCHFTEWHKN